VPVVTLRLLKTVFLLGVLVLGTPFETGVASAQTLSAARRPIIFVPGLLGSRLCRDNPANPASPTLVWGSAAALKSFPTLRVTGGTDDIKPCGILRDIVFLGLLVQDVYAPVIAHLHKLGYREGVNLFIFDYDWRRSAFDNAAKLESFVREKIPDPFQRFDILAHSKPTERRIGLKHHSSITAESSRSPWRFCAESICPRSGRSWWIWGMKLSRDPCSASTDSAHARSATFASRRARTSPSAP